MRVIFNVSEYQLKLVLDILTKQGAKLIDVFEDDGYWFIRYGSNNVPDAVETRKDEEY